VTSPEQAWRLAAMSEFDLPSTGRFFSALREKLFIFCLGIEKSGTTSLYDFLKPAAHISVSKIKELEFFSTNLNRGFFWYFSNFDLNKRALLDATPSYHWNNPAMWRIRECCDNVLITLMLRNPIDRAYSAYCHRAYWFFLNELNAGRSLDSFNLTISEFARLQNRDAPGFQFIFPSYIDVLERVLGEYNAAFDVKQFIPVIMENFVTDPYALVHQIEQRLNIELGVPAGQTVQRTNSLCFPQFYRGDELLQLPGAELARIDPGSCYICRNGKLTRVGDSASYPLFKLLERKWLAPLSANDARYIFHSYYERDIEEIERRFALDLGKWRNIRERFPRLSAPTLGDVGGHT
jgi:hypothetical protein